MNYNLIIIYRAQFKPRRCMCVEANPATDYFTVPTLRRLCGKLKKYIVS